MLGVAVFVGTILGTGVAMTIMSRSVSKSNDKGQDLAENKDYCRGGIGWRENSDRVPKRYLEEFKAKYGRPAEWQ